eukprot:565100-Amphidinium_carterae.1
MFMTTPSGDVPFPQQSGVPQGRPDSPELFIQFLDCALGHVARTWQRDGIKQVALRDVIVIHLECKDDIFWCLDTRWRKLQRLSCQ